MLIFLDIDGVMVPAASWKTPEFLEDGFPVFSTRATRVLQSLISVNTTVMLTTSHKSKFTIDEWKCIFEKRGLKVAKLKTLETSHSCLNRKDEVLNWFNLNNVNEDYVIIDDDKSLNALPSYLKNKLILTSSLIGLTDSHLEELKTILERESQFSQI